MRLGVAAAVIGGELIRGDLDVHDGVVTRAGLPARVTTGIAVPGFIDLQVNGFAGVDFLTADREGYRAAAERLAATGVTAYQPTLISSPLEVYWPALGTVDAVARERTAPRILGVHLEGPFLSPDFSGAHEPQNLIDPDLGLADRLCGAGPVTTMTLAPERPGGLDLVERLTAQGVVVSLGHCDADATTAGEAYNRGARAITHVHNAQRRWQARDPGVSGVALTRRDVTVTAIVDTVHLAPETVLAAFLAARGRFALITDAIEAAGLPPGRYRVGDRQVEVSDGQVRLPDGTLAGSVLTMDQAVRNLVELGVPRLEAFAAASLAPARLLDQPHLGTLRPGHPADIAVLDDALQVRRTLVAGTEVYAAG